MVQTWPLDLPQSPLVEGFSQARGNGRRSSKTDTGPGKVWRKTSAVASPMSFKTLMTAAQLESFETFYITSILEGSLPFTYPNPMGGSDLTVRFKPEETYEFESPDGGVHYYVTMPLEIMP